MTSDNAAYNVAMCARMDAAEAVKLASRPNVLPYFGMQPTRAHEGDAGYDLRAAKGHTLPPGQRGLISTDLHVSIPEGYAGLIVPRSGLALKHGVTVLNAPGLIDPGYTGEVKALLINHGHETFLVRPGDRIAQLLLVRAEHPAFTPAPSLADLQLLADRELGARGDGGFGSSGVA